MQKIIMHSLFWGELGKGSNNRPDAFLRDFLKSIFSNSRAVVRSVVHSAPPGGQQPVPCGADASHVNMWSSVSGDY